MFLPCAEVLFNALYYSLFTGVDSPLRRAPLALFLENRDAYSSCPKLAHRARGSVFISPCHVPARPSWVFSFCFFLVCAALPPMIFPKFPPSATSPTLPALSRKPPNNVWKRLPPNSNKRPARSWLSSPLDLSTT